MLTPLYPTKIDQSYTIFQVDLLHSKYSSTIISPKYKIIVFTHINIFFRDINLKYEINIMYFYLTDIDVLTIFSACLLNLQKTIFIHLYSPILMNKWFNIYKYKLKVE